MAPPLTSRLMKKLLQRHAVSVSDAKRCRAVGREWGSFALARM
jgi:hypothetical protein